MSGLHRTANRGRRSRRHPAPGCPVPRTRAVRRGGETSNLHAVFRRAWRASWGKHPADVEHRASAREVNQEQSSGCGAGRAACARRVPNGATSRRVVDGGWSWSCPPGSRHARRQTSLPVREHRYSRVGQVVARQEFAAEKGEEAAGEGSLMVIDRRGQVDVIDSTESTEGIAGQSGLLWLLRSSSQWVPNGRTGRRAGIDHSRLEAPGICAVIGGVERTSASSGPHR